MTTPAPTVRLAHGAEMPRLGLGTWPMDDAEAERVVADALVAGYRLVDTAYNYGNETGVGRGVRASGIPRDEVFITTKLNREWHGVDEVADAVRGSADRLGVDRIDLMLIHWPNPDQDRYVEAWTGLVGLLEDGVVAAIGTSNFKAAHLERIAAATGVLPDVNQVQLSPYTTRGTIRAYNAEHGIVTQSWSPLGQGNDLLRNPVVVGVAERNGVTPGEAVLAWHLALGLATVPKSSDPQRLRRNLAAASLVLDPGDVEALSALDRGESEAVDSDTFGH